MLNEFYKVSLIKEFNYELIFNEMSKLFGLPGEKWFLYNGSLYIREGITYTWFMLKYG